MSKASIFVGGVLLFALFIGMWLVGNYNSLVTAKAQVDKAWAGVETQYQYRFDLIDNLVQSAKGAQKQEIEVFGKIAESRSRLLSAGTTDEKVSAINDMETNIALIPRLQEAYPELKSNNQVKELMDELITTEKDIAVKRTEYNSTATNYNVGVTRFPKSKLASMWGFDKVALFKADSEANKAVKVQF